MGWLRTRALACSKKAAAAAVIAVGVASVGQAKEQVGARFVVKLGIVKARAKGVAVSVWQTAA